MSAVDPASDSFVQTNRIRILKFVLTILLLAVVLALSVNAEFYSSAMTSAFLSLALVSSLIVLGMIRRRWFDLLWVIAGALCLAGLDCQILRFKPMFMAGFSFIGLSAFVVLGVHTIWARGADRKLLLHGFVPVVLFVGSEWLASTLLDVTERLHPKTFDLFLYSFDSSLRVPISFLVGQSFWTFPWLRAVCLVFYIALPLPLALVYSAHLRHAKSSARSVMIAFLATGPLGVLFYNMMPACGPIHIFGPGFPFHPLSTAEAMRMQVVPVLVKGARNAIPSLHMAWVLLVWWNSRGLPRWVRSIALAFVWFTVLATLGTGEHYFIDLAVAFPFSLMVQALSSYSLPFSSRERRVPFLFGAFLTFLWLGVLSFATRLFWISPLIPWIMIAATVSSSVWLWRRLLRACEPKAPEEQEQSTHCIAKAVAAV
jgi:PAP2 superfamily